MDGFHVLLWMCVCVCLCICVCDVKDAALLPVSLKKVTARFCITAVACLIRVLGCHCFPCTV